jgi:hypothetical protein
MENNLAEKIFNQITFIARKHTKKEIENYNEIEIDKLRYANAIKSKETKESDVFETKIRSGIMRLKNLEAFDEAAFYETEIIKIAKTNTNRKNNELYFFLFSIAGLALIACFGNKLLYETFSLYKKVIDTIIHYFK